MELMNFLKDIQQSTTEIEKEKLSEKESQTTILNFFGDFNVFSLFFVNLFIK